MKFSPRRILFWLFTVGFGIGLLGAAALTVYLNSSSFKERARLYLIEQLGGFSGGEVSIQTFSWNIATQRFVITGLRVRGLEADADPPLAFFPQIEIGLRLRSLFQRRVDLFDLTITRPEINLIVDSRGNTNFPPRTLAAPAPSEFEINSDSLWILDGSITINENRTALDFGGRNVNARLAYHSSSGILNVESGYEGTIRTEQDRTLSYRADALFDITRGHLIAHSIRLTSGNSNASLQGRIDDLLQSSMRGRFAHRADLDTVMLRRFTASAAGDLRAEGTIEFDRSRLAATGVASSPELEWNTWTLRKARSDYAYDSSGARLKLTQMAADLLGGSAQGVLEWEFRRSRATFDLAVQRIDTELLGDLITIGQVRPAALVSGTISGQSQTDGRDYAVDARLVLSETGMTRVAGGVTVISVSGPIVFHAADSEVLIESADLRTGQTRLEAAGRIQRSALDLQVRLESADLTDLQFVDSRAHGSGSFAGQVSGTPASPTTEGVFTVSGYHYSPWTIDEATGKIRINRERLDFEAVRARAGGRRLNVSGHVVLPEATTGQLDVQFSGIEGADVGRWLDQATLGVFSGEARITNFAPLQASGEFLGTLVRIGQIDLGEISSRFSYLPERLSLERISVRRSGMRIDGNATVHPEDGRFRFELSAARIGLSDIRDLGVPAWMDGTILSARISGDGSRDRPNIRGSARLEELKIASERLGTAAIEIESEGSEITAGIEAGNVRGVARIRTASGLPFTASLDFRNYVLRNAGGVQAATVTATGSARVEGRAGELTSFRGNGRLVAVAIETDQGRLESTRPLEFDITRERVFLTGAAFAGRGTQLELAGTIALAESAELGLDVRGRIDLPFLTSGFRNVSTTGTLNVDGVIRGTPANPELRGIARLTNATLTSPALPLSLTTVSGSVFFDENRITINDVTGRAGGGTLAFQGSALLRQRRIEGMNIRVDARDVRLRYPAGVRTVVDGSLSVSGTSADPIVQGDVRVQSLAFRESFEELLSSVSSAMALGPGGDAGRTDPRLAIRITGDRNISVQNDLVQADARIDLEIRGTVSRPTLTGHIEATDGSLALQGIRYRITRGNVDFVDPLRVDPLVDIQAEAQLRDYQVILNIAGRGEGLRLEMRSDPPLSQLEIVGLIAGRRTTEELAATGSPLPTSEQVFQGGAASLLADLLQQRVTNRFNRIGLDRFRIDPFLVGGENDPVARVTLAKQVTKDLSITYSQDVASNRQQVILIEYFVSPTTSIIASRDETGALGLDVRFRKRFK